MVHFMLGAGVFAVGALFGASLVTAALKQSKPQSNLN